MLMRSDLKSESNDPVMGSVTLSSATDADRNPRWNEGNLAKDRAALWFFLVDRIELQACLLGADPPKWSNSWNSWGTPGHPPKWSNSWNSWTPTGSNSWTPTVRSGRRLLDGTFGHPLCGRANPGFSGCPESLPACRGSKTSSPRRNFWKKLLDTHCAVGRIRGSVGVQNQYRLAADVECPRPK